MRKGAQGRETTLARGSKDRAKLELLKTSLEHARSLGLGWRLTAGTRHRLTYY